MDVASFSALPFGESNPSAQDHLRYPHSLENILQVSESRLELPKTHETWSTWYAEAADSFNDFSTFNPPPHTPAASTAAVTAPGGSGTPAATTTSSCSQGGRMPSSSSTSFRTRSVRQLSGQFEDEVARSWEDDWEDEDAEDTYDAIMGKITHYTTREHQYNQRLYHKG